MTTKDVNAAIWAIEAPEAVKRGILGPMYTRSIDASMAVIQRRWDDPLVTMYSGTTSEERIATLGPGNGMPKTRGEGATYAHALAIALLAALEAETKP